MISLSPWHSWFGILFLKKKIFHNSKAYLNLLSDFLTHSFIYIYTYIYTHTHTHTYIYTYTHTYTFLFGPFRAALAAYGSFQARGQIRATAVSLYHSHSNTRSGPHLQPTPQKHQILNPLMGPGLNQHPHGY